MTKTNKTTKALKNILDKYVSLVNSGDAGFWDPETEPQVIEARRILESVSTKRRTQ